MKKMIAIETLMNDRFLLSGVPYENVMYVIKTRNYAIEAYTKEEVIDMFAELIEEIEKLETNPWAREYIELNNSFEEGKWQSKEVIQRKINALKGNE